MENPASFFNIFNSCNNNWYDFRQPVADYMFMSIREASDMWGQEHQEPLKNDFSWSLPEKSKDWAHKNCK